MPAISPDPVPGRALRRRRRPVLATALALTAGLAVALAAPAGAHDAALKRGSHGAAVVVLQQRLHLSTDGAFGPQTERAVRRFQARHRLTVDGIVGARTAAALHLRLAPAGRAARGHGARVHVPAILRRIAQCESGGNPRAVSPGGSYRGKYQFDRGTWRAMGGHGDPARASEAEQDRRALALLHARGTAPWPNCA
jgi:resuscitation-promoting factor RpfB